MKTKSTLNLAKGNMGFVSNLPVGSQQQVLGGYKAANTGGGGNSGSEEDQFNGSTDEQGPSEIDL